MGFMNKFLRAKEIVDLSENPEKEVLIYYLKDGSIVTEYDKKIVNPYGENVLNRYSYVLKSSLTDKAKK